MSLLPNVSFISTASGSAPLSLSLAAYAGNDLLGGDLAPAGEDRGVEGADIGKMPVKTAA